jgi:hypothetical protein
MLRRVLEAPELNVAIFAFLLNYPWEFLQVPFYENMANARHWEAVLFCSRATIGDAAIAVISFWAVAGHSRSRAWILRPTPFEVAGFVAAGVGITIMLEWLATEILNRWRYAEAMPTLPLLGTGLLPLLQWLILPPLVVWFVRRQLT